MTTPLPKLVIAADVPPQWAGSPQFDRLRAFTDATLYPDLPADDAEQMRRVQDAEVVISPVRLKWTEETLARLPNLRLIVLVAIGTDSVDLEPARRYGVSVCNVPGRTAPVVAEHALALMLAAARKLPSETANVKAGEWKVRRTTLLRGRTLGVVGAGHIGAATARLAKAIGMEVVAWTLNPSPERAERLGLRFVSLDELLRTADVVSLHTRLTERTRHLIGRRELALMKDGAILVNVARGGVVDNLALAEALTSGKLGGAGLDVFDPEPVPPDHPLLSCGNVVLTPHVADNTPEGMEFLNEGAVDAVEAFLAGTPINVVN